MRKGTLYGLADYDITRNGEVINNHNGHVVKPQPNGKGYLRVHIDGRMQFVHRLVAEKYVPNPENKPQINHIDGNKLNNSVDNLEWVTNQENRDHAVEHGLQPKGEKCPYAKLTRENVDYIRKHTEMSNKELAEKFNMSASHISSIRRNAWWKD